MARLEQLSYYPELLERVLCLHQQGLGCRAIATQLNTEQWRPAKRRATFNGPMVANLLARQGVCLDASARRQPPWADRQAHEWSIKELSRQLEMPSATVFSWLYKGQLQARQVERGGHHQWLVWADAAELERLRVQRDAPRRWTQHRRVDSNDAANDPVS